VKASIIGFIFWIAAGVMFAFKVLSVLMEKNIEVFTISQIVGGTDWVEKIPWPVLQKWAFTISETPIWFLLLAIGAVFIVIGMFRKA